MKNNVTKYFIVPGALGLVLVCPAQGTFAQESGTSIDSKPVNKTVAEEKANTNNMVASLNSPEKREAKPLHAQKTTVEGEAHAGDDSEPSFEDLSGKAKEKKDADPEKKRDIQKNEKKDDRYPHSIDHQYEDKNHNKNFQDHSIEAENDGSYQFKKGNELTEKEIKEEFDKYKKNVSSFVKVQEWIPKLKDMNLLDLKGNEKSQFYKVVLKDGNTIYSADGFKSYVDKYGNAYVHDLTDDKVYKLDGGYSYSSGGFTAPEVKNVYGSSSTDIKNTADDLTNPLHKRVGTNSKVYKTVERDGAYVKKIVDKNGNISYEFYDGSENETKKKVDVEKIKKVVEETPSALMEVWGKEHYDELIDRAYKAALVNSYLVKHEPNMSQEDRKSIVDYVYRFGLNFNADESMVSKSEDNGYVNVSPLGYATQNPDGSYKYRYQVSFNSVTSNDKYSSTKLDVYAPTMAKNIKFILNGVQEYKKNSDGSYSYKNRDVNVELGIVNTKDQATRVLLEADRLKTDDTAYWTADGKKYYRDEYVPESIWNNEEYKHKENTFSIPYYNDIHRRTRLENKVVEFDRLVDFYGDQAQIEKSKYTNEPNYYSGYRVLRPEKHYRHF